MGPQATPPRVRVSAATGSSGAALDLTFDRPFTIGRAAECDVCIVDDYVSRKHADVIFHNGQWWIRDLRSANGIFVEDARVEAAPLAGTCVVRLGVAGPLVTFRVEIPAPEPPPRPEPQPQAEVAGNQTVTAKSVERYFQGSPDSKDIGEHTQMVRRAFQTVQKRQRRRYVWVIAVLLAAVAAVGAFALWQRRQLEQQRATAQELFYQMKALDVDISGLEKVVLASGNQQAVDQVKKYQSRRKDLEKNYDKFLSSLHIYDRKMPESERLVLRVARIFGECELAMPPGFADEVGNYVKKWQSSGRYARAVQKARDNNYTQAIARELLAQGLPPQFFYLAMQESDFDAYISGPPTYKGIAKGMWQFIPETGQKYGLKIGPLADLRRPDPADDRHHWELATRAAARYLKDIYTTDAQASGLLVMASYNWGEHRVVKLIQSMPPNPQDRNFWKLLAQHRAEIPEETYNYVFYIVSAAVIGENPRLFGFDFDNPLAFLEQR